MSEQPHINIPETSDHRVVIVGAGFAGLILARKLARKKSVQVVLIDKNNYHQFQPLFYQVAMAGLDSASICFPLRKLFQRVDNVFVRVTEVSRVDTMHKTIHTALGPLHYDTCVLAMGCDTNFFGDAVLAEKAIPMKSLSEALFLRNAILSDLERALTTGNFADRQGLLDVVIVGGGPTGVELAGALAEMKKYILPKEYRELNAGELDIHLIQSPPVLLKGMSEKASTKAREFLEELGVIVRTGMRVVSYDGRHATLKDGSTIRTDKLIWAAGVTGNRIEGLPEGVVERGNRIRVDQHCRVIDCPDLYAIGDVARMSEGEAWSEGHPQVAQVAIQQGRFLARHLLDRLRQKTPSPFTYRDKGSMATIGRNRAVVDLKRRRLAGWFAWIIWLFVHLFALIGTRNKLFVFINWVWNYLTYDQYLRLIIRPAKRKRVNDPAGPSVPARPADSAVSD